MTRWSIGIAVAMTVLVVSADADAQRTVATSVENQPVAVVGDRWIPIGAGATLAAFASHPLVAPRLESEAEGALRAMVSAPGRLPCPSRTRYKAYV